MSLKKLFGAFALFFGLAVGNSAHAGIPVIDAANMTQNLMNHVEDVAKFVEQIEQLKAQLTQMQLAQRLEVGQSFVSKIERGDAYVDVMLFVDWCMACGVNPAQALEQVVNQTPDSMGLSRR